MPVHCRSLAVHHFQAEKMLIKTAENLVEALNEMLSSAEATCVKVCYKVSDMEQTVYDILKLIPVVKMSITKNIPKLHIYSVQGNCDFPEIHVTSLFLKETQILFINEMPFKLMWENHFVDGGEPLWHVNLPSFSSGFCTVVSKSPGSISLMLFTALGLCMCDEVDWCTQFCKIDCKQEVFPEECNTKVSQISWPCCNYK